MELPDLSQMSIWGWLVLAAVVIFSAISIFVVDDEEKKGRNKPGKLCGGRPCEESPAAKKDEEDINMDTLML